MGLWTFLTIFFVLVFISGTVKHYLSVKAEQGSPDEVLEEMKIELNRLKSRVENLEAIAVNETKEEARVNWTDFTVEEEEPQTANTRSRTKE